MVPMAPKSVIEMLNDTVNKYPEHPAVSSKKDGIWHDKSWTEVQEISRKIAGGLISRGFGAGDRGAIISNTREEWFFADLGIVHSAGVSIPVYPSNLPDECFYILDNSESSIVFVEDAVQLEKIESIRDRLPLLKEIFIINDSDKKPGVTSLADLVNEGATFLESNREVLTERAAGIDEDTLLTFIYTSGTTGPPKGVVLTHKVFTRGAPAIINSYPISTEDDQLLFLPLAHSFAKMLTFSIIPLGSRTYFAESLEKVVDNIAETNPSWLAAVPRIYEKIYQKAMTGAEEAGGLKQKIFGWASEIASKKSRLEQAGDYVPFLLKFQHSLADKLVYSKIRALFGTRFRFSVSGGAPLSTDIAHWFAGAGVTICEGYGLTETNSMTSANRPEDNRIGTAGIAWPGVEVKAADDGELLIKGPTNLKEYFKDPEATAEVLKDGWLHTGDIGEVDGDGFIKITDRKKDIIVTAGGKNIAPQNIENLMKTSPFISQVMVHGDKRKFLTALITCDEEYITGWAEKSGLSSSGMTELANNDKLIAALDDEVKRFNEQLPSYSTIKRFRLLKQDFAQETGELTPSLKVKRKVVTDKFMDLIDDMYSDVK